MKKTYVVSVISLFLLVFGSFLTKATADKDSSSVKNSINVTFAEDEKNRSILKIYNQTPFVIILYLQNVRVGWLRPNRTGVMRGLKTGYHRVYAHSRWGSAYWGPIRVWVPGQWNLFK